MDTDALLEYPTERRRLCAADYAITDFTKTAKRSGAAVFWMSQPATAAYTFSLSLHTNKPSTASEAAT